MRPDKTNPAISVLTITVGFTLIFIVTGWSWAIYAAIVVGVLGLLSNQLRQYIDFLWMKLAQVLGYIVPNVLLTLIFFLVLFPVALLSNLIKRNDLLALKNTHTSMFKKRDKLFEKQDFEKMW